MRTDEIVHHDRVVQAKNGWLMLVANIGIFLLSVVAFIAGIVHLDEHGGSLAGFARLFGGILGVGLGVLSMIGHFTLQPNEGRIQVLFGAYKGTVLESGFHWANPFYSKLDVKVSARTRNFQSEVLKVNDKQGNPIEIAAVVVWRVANGQV